MEKKKRYIFKLCNLRDKNETKNGYSIQFPLCTSAEGTSSCNSAQSIIHRSWSLCVNTSLTETYISHMHTTIIAKFVVIQWKVHILSTFTLADFTSDWWLVRVTLVVDWLFLPWNFGAVVGTYAGLLLFCECTWGGGSMLRWWGHLYSLCLKQTFCAHRWWGP